MKKAQLVVFIGVLVSAGCTANEPSEVRDSGSTSDAGHIADASNLGPSPENIFTHKMIKPSGEGRSDPNQFPTLSEPRRRNWDEPPMYQGTGCCGFGMSGQGNVGV